MSAPINTISQDFCLYDAADESSFDYPLFNPAVAVNKKTTSAANNSAAAAFLTANPLCTPQTPSIDLVSAPATRDAALGFDALFDDSTLTPQLSLLNTPFTPYLDTPALVDTVALETPYLDFGLESALDSKLAAASHAAGFSSLFPDFAFDTSFDQVYSIAPNMLLPLDQQQYALPSPDISDLLSAPASPVKAVTAHFDHDHMATDDDEEEDDQFVHSRSAALVSGLKRKASTAALSPVKKTIGLTANAAAPKATATKRFSCNHPGCDRRFARLFNLHTHEKTHDPEQARPFICSDADCGKAFSRKHDLQRHEASVHKGERNFACTKCLKPFSRQDGLRRHLAVKGSCSDNDGLAT
ncbi:hypothetical protein BG015_001318 [Linnemannia schmuckeri]|uniref:C2H2-type domain-containing protein n=1 Tax=Linnemannia schmuckeri TaxID=64567 RepID=A0A9P5V6J7_9FUNG|nr:hypothetical protein BG015_001318 [Linnemannia schmuckeri]